MADTAKTDAADETKAREQDKKDAAAEIKSEQEAKDAAVVADRIAGKAQARADAAALRKRESGDAQGLNAPADGDSDLEAALKALGAEVDRIGAIMIGAVSSGHASAVAAAAALHALLPNAKVPPEDPTWKGVSTEDRISYEVDRLAGVRRALFAKETTMHDDSPDAHRAKIAADEARTPAQKKADADAKQKASDDAAAAQKEADKKAAVEKAKDEKK